MNILTANYVNFSDVFFGLELAKEAFFNSDPDCSYGNNNRTLVTIETIVDALETMEGADKDTDEEILQVKEILQELPSDVYIDLEN